MNQKQIEEKINNNVFLENDTKLKNQIIEYISCSYEHNEDTKYTEAEIDLLVDYTLYLIYGGD
jgi:hypothetical protein